MVENIQNLMAPRRREEHQFFHHSIIHNIFQNKIYSLKNVMGERVELWELALKSF